MQYIYPWQLLCLSPTVGIFFLCHFLNSPAASFTQWIHLASKEVGWQSSTGCMRSGKDPWLPAHPAPHGLLLGCLLIQPSVLLCCRLLGPWLTISLLKGGGKENKPQQACCSCAWCASAKLPFPRKEMYLSCIALCPVFSQQASRLQNSMVAGNAWQLCWQHQPPSGFQRHLWLKPVYGSGL